MQRLLCRWQIKRPLSNPQLHLPPHQPLLPPLLGFLLLGKPLHQPDLRWKHLPLQAEFCRMLRHRYANSRANSGSTSPAFKAAAQRGALRKKTCKRMSRP